MPQIGGMYRGDRARKETLVEYGFRLPSALDNRPLKFEEFESDDRTRSIYVSATPGDYELERSGRRGRRAVIRPTGLIDPEIEVRPARSQVDDLLDEIRKRVERRERVLVTTLTKRMAEDLTDYLPRSGRQGALPALGDRHARAGRDHPRPAQAASSTCWSASTCCAKGSICPKCRWSRFSTPTRKASCAPTRSLIQTIGRAARNVNGTVILYADGVTDSMKRAIDETDRRRGAGGLQRGARHHAADDHQGPGLALVQDYDADYVDIPMAAEDAAQYRPGELNRKLRKLQKEMKEAAQKLEFERAAELRDQIRQLQSQELTLRDSPLDSIREGD